VISFILNISVDIFSFDAFLLDEMLFLDEEDSVSFSFDFDFDFFFGFILLLFFLAIAFVDVLSGLLCYLLFCFM
jgi:hypothetical protein